MAKYLDITNDIAFKRVFANKEHKDITLNFLNAILERPEGRRITSIEFLNTDNIPAIKEEKFSIVDMRCVDQANETYIVELQARPQANFGKRCQFYASITLVKQMDNAENKNYEKLAPVILIGILDFVMFKRHDRFHCHHYLADRVDGVQDLKLMEFHFIELPKFTKTETELENDMERWIYFFKNSGERNIRPESITKKNKAIDDAFGLLDSFNWTKNEMFAYDRWLDIQRMNEDAEATAIKTKFAEGVAKGKAEGRAEGVAEKAIAIARAMLSEGISATIIAKVTGLTVEEIKSL